ncbi:hypothetical protein [Longimicrobium sp.]|jgi:hypothetical protein|uniref:hypothetical protein n=1 Tax=Longimicrobium sp. TaxID=2029185 RepID=UPI002F94B665
MQMHPSDPANAMRYAVESIAAGFIGLDFAGDVGDLRRVQRESLPPGQTDYHDFANRMQRGDRVLVMVHHFPFAVVSVAGDYNYVATPEPELGVWFRHFRRIDKGATRYYADRITNAKAWQPITMTDTISILKDPTGQTYQLIEGWS